MQRIIDVACEACRKAENAGLLSRGRLRRAAARTVAEQSELLRRTAPWLKDAARRSLESVSREHFLSVYFGHMLAWCVQSTQILCLKYTDFVCTLDTDEGL